MRVSGSRGSVRYRHGWAAERESAEASSRIGLRGEDGGEDQELERGFGGCKRGGDQREPRLKTCRRNRARRVHRMSFMEQMVSCKEYVDWSSAVQ